MPMYYYGDQLSPNISETPQGYLICKDVPIGRTGTMKYLAKDLPVDGVDPFTLIPVSRDDSEVFDAATLASFEGLPVTDDHPSEDVTVENASFYAKGHVQNVRRGEGEDADKMLADLFITDPILINKIKNKNKRQVSSGYSCLYGLDEAGDMKQRRLRGNHVAVVAKGRAGESVAIKDSKPDESTNKVRERRLPLMPKFGESVANVLRLAVRSAKDATGDDQENIIMDAASAINDLAPTAQDCDNSKLHFQGTPAAGAKPAEISIGSTKDEDAQMKAVADKLDVLIDLMTAKVTDASAAEAKEEQKEAGKELAKGDKDLKKAEDAAVQDALSPASVKKAGAATANALEMLVEKIGLDAAALMADTADEADEADKADTQDANAGCKSNWDGVTDALFIPIDTGIQKAVNQPLDIKAFATQLYPTIASIKDSADRQKVADALLQLMDDSVNPVSMGNLMQATAANARQNAQTPMMMDSANDLSMEKAIEAAQSAYDARNPHIKKGA